MIMGRTRRAKQASNEIQGKPYDLELREGMSHFQYHGRDGCREWVSDGLRP